MADWSVKHLYGLTFDLKYHDGNVFVKMPSYVQKALQNISINHQNHPNFHHFQPLHTSNISRDNANMHQKLIHPRCYPLLELQGCNKPSALFYFMIDLLIKNY